MKQISEMESIYDVLTTGIFNREVLVILFTTKTNVSAELNFSSRGRSSGQLAPRVGD